MDRPKRSLKWRTVLLTLLGLVGSATVAYFLNRVAVDRWIGGVQNQISAAQLRHARLQVSKKSPHAPLRDLADGTFSRGSSADDWFAKYPPTKCRYHDEYAVAYYEGGSLTVVARAGRLVSAKSGLCEYFTFATEADEEAFQASVERWYQGYFTARAAVAGVAPDAATLRPWHYLRTSP